MDCYEGENQAIAQTQRMIELELNVPQPYHDLVSVYEQAGRYEDAIETRRQFTTSPPEKIAAMDSAYAESGPEG
jgi:hypothetical protein